MSFDFGLNKADPSISLSLSVAVETILRLDDALGSFLMVGIWGNAFEVTESARVFRRLVEVGVADADVLSECGRAALSGVNFLFDLDAEDWASGVAEAGWSLLPLEIG